MAKDKIGYKLSKKNAHGSLQLETQVGVTTSMYCVAQAGPKSRWTELLETRPTALFKWAFDDFIVEEVLPPCLKESRNVESEGNRDSSLVRVVSQGVPDSVVARHLKSVVGTQAVLHFLTPVDFVSCSTRYVWIRMPFKNVKEAVGSLKVFHTRYGKVYVDDVVQLHLDPAAAFFPPNWLPCLRYTITLRNIQANLASILSPLRNMMKTGFLNYSHAGRHGLSLLSTYQDGKSLLRRDYPTFVQHYAKGLTEGSVNVRRELMSLLDVLVDPKCTSKDWKGIVEGMEMAVRQDSELMRLPQTGLYPPHHALLNDFVQRAATVYPQHHDSAQLIRESISRNVLHDKLRGVSDVHFNASASLRMEAHGTKVVRGDYVLTDRSKLPYLDNYEGAADHINGSIVENMHPLWGEFCDIESYNKENIFPYVKVVETDSEAAKYTFEDVVLPLYGSNTRELPFPLDSQTQALADQLQINGLDQMRLAYPASYKSLSSKPDVGSYGFYIFDEARQWEWEEGSKAALLKSMIYKDQENITRVRSPLMTHSGKNMIARPGIRGAEVRHHFLKPARKAGAICVMQLQLPRGTAITSALREAFQFATISPSAVYRILLS